nr:MAG TPA: hypothetical protein [Caudoviricetes sp.]
MCNVGCFLFTYPGQTHPLSIITNLRSQVVEDGESLYNIGQYWFSLYLVPSRQMKTVIFLLL